jgi:Mg-chelatase subunit ChlD
VVTGSTESQVAELSKAEELKGSLQPNFSDDKLMHSVLENDKETIDEGKLIESALNQGIGAFTPDLLFEQLVKNYAIAENIFGQKLLRHICGYEPDYIEKNIQIHDFQKELKRKIEQKVEKLKKDKVIDSEGQITEKGIELASLVMYVEELDNIIPKGMTGERVHKKFYIYGSKEDTRQYKKGDRYKDIEKKKSIKTAIRRGHKSLEVDDLKVYERQSKGQCNIIYAMDSSGSMKGKKIETSKKAGIALAYKATQEKDKVGLLIFGDEIISKVEPTTDFSRLLKEVVSVRAASQTDFVKTIKKSIEMFPSTDVTKHLMLLTDALPTVGEEPEKETLEAVSAARSNDITISVIGINLDEKGKALAEKIVEIGQGKLYVVKDLEELDKIVLEDYYAVA